MKIRLISVLCAFLMIPVYSQADPVEDCIFVYFPSNVVLRRAWPFLGAFANLTAALATASLILRVPQAQFSSFS